MGAYRSALMTRAITGGVADIAGALTDWQRTKLMQGQQAQEQERFGLLKKQSEREETQFQDKYRTITADQLRLKLNYHNEPPEVQKLLDSWVETSSFDVNGVPTIYKYRIDDMVEKLSTNPQWQNNILSARQTGYRNLKEKIRQQLDTPNPEKPLSTKEREEKEIQYKNAVTQENATTSELNMNPHYQAKMKAEIEAEKAKQEQTTANLFAQKYAEETGDVTGATTISSAGANAREAYAELSKEFAEKKPQTDYFKWLQDRGLKDSPANQKDYFGWIEKEAKLTKKPVEVNIGFTKATQTDLEKEQMQAEQRLSALDDIESSFKDEYLTYKGVAKGYLQKTLNKAGFLDEPTFLKNRSEWFVGAQAELLKWRKWVTGVAGGEREYGEIAKSWPDPNTNSPSEFKSNLKATKRNIKKVLNWTQITRVQGLSIGDTPEKISGKGKGGSLQGISTQELIEMLERTQ